MDLYHFGSLSREVPQEALVLGSSHFHAEILLAGVKIPAFNVPSKPGQGVPVASHKDQLLFLS